MQVMEILTIFSELGIKDWLIGLSLIILLACVLEIHRLKKAIIQETRRRLLPFFKLELALDDDLGRRGFYLENESFFLAKDIKIKDVHLFLDDLGYPLNTILRFADVEWLKPHERVKLDLRVFDQKGDFLPQVSERIIPHLVSPAFTINVCYENVEGLKFSTNFLKRRDKFTSAEITTLEPIHTNR